MNQVKAREIATQSATEQVLVLHGEEATEVDVKDWFQKLYQFAHDLRAVGEEMQKEEDQSRLKDMKDAETKVGNVDFSLSAAAALYSSGIVPATR
jgi:hypothetical protein